MKSLRDLIRGLRQDSQGQTILALALMFVVLMGFTAMVSDAGIAYWNRRILQNAVDGAALAAGESMLGASPATTATVYQVAYNYAASNGVNPTEIANVTEPAFELQVTAEAVGGNTYPKAIVSARRHLDFGLRYFVGAGNSDVVSTAAVLLAPVNPQRSDLLPFAVLYGTTCAPTQNPDGSFGCEVKTDAHGNNIGNFGPVTYPNNPDCNGQGSGNSASCYDITVANGFRGAVPTSTAWFQTNPGNMPNGTSSSVQQLFSEDAQYLCDGVFTLQGNTPVLTQSGQNCDDPQHYVSSPGQGGSTGCSSPTCDPYQPVTPDGRVCYKFTECPRVGIIPLIDATSWPTGSKTVNIKGYACFYISGYAPGPGGGNQQNVSGFFVDTKDGCIPRTSDGMLPFNLNVPFGSTGQTGVVLWR